jgi:hypothetical protein
MRSLLGGRAAASGRPPAENGNPEVNGLDVSLIWQNPAFFAGLTRSCADYREEKESKTERVEVNWWSAARPDRFPNSLGDGESQPAG